MKQRFMALSLVIALVGTFAFSRPAAAAPEVLQAQGAIGLVNVLAALNDTLDVGDVAILNSSFNNLRALNNVLNNSPILNNADIDVNILSVEDVLSDIVIRDVLQNFLNANDIDVTLTDFLNNNVVAIGVLGDGVIIFQ